MNKRTLRIKSDLQSVSNDLSDVLTSTAPKFFSGEDVDIQVGIFTGAAVEDVSTITSVTTEVKVLSRGGPPLSNSAYIFQVTNSSFDNTLDTTSWADGSKQHFTIQFTDTQTALLKEGIKWLSSFATLSDGTKVTLFAGKIQVTEDGTGDSSGSDTLATLFTASGDILTYNGSSAIVKPKGLNGQSLTVSDADVDGDNTNLTWTTPAGGGDVIGPASSADNALTRFDGLTGKAVQTSTASIDDSGNLDVQGNITLTGTVDGRDLAADGTKLDGIEASATADQTGAEIKTLYEAEANTNAYDDAAVSKLAGIEANATADQTGAEIKALYEAEANTNAFTDAEKTKLTGIEASADVTDETNVKAALDGATITAATVAGTDKVLIQDADDLDNLKTVTAQSIADLSSGAVTSVNGLDGVVVLDPDDLSDTLTTNKFTTAADISKLAGIEALADVTDATNVDAAGAVMNSDTSTASMSFVIDEDNMASNSATKVPTQQSVKAYVDASAGGGGGAWVSLANGTISGSPTDVDMTGMANASYKQYKLVIHRVSISANDECYLQVSDDSGSTFEAFRGFVRTIWFTSAAANTWANSGSPNWIPLTGNSGNERLSSTGSMSVEVNFMNDSSNVFQALSRSQYLNYTSGDVPAWVESHAATNTAIYANLIRLTTASGTTTFGGGSWELYGLTTS